MAVRAAAVFTSPTAGPLCVDEMVMPDQSGREQQRPQYVLFRKNLRIIDGNPRDFLRGIRVFFGQLESHALPSPPGATMRRARAHPYPQGQGAEAQGRTARRRRAAQAAGSANRVLNVLNAVLDHAWHERKVASNEAWLPVRSFREIDAPVVRYFSARTYGAGLTSLAGMTLSLFRLKYFYPYLLPGAQT
jgi:hypothetical protein